ncbi:MAG: RNA polymerase sigma factor [Planctomycetota bacterium]
MSVQDDATATGGGNIFDRETFARLFADASRRAWVMAVGVLLDRHAADDVVQEAAVVAWRRRDSFDPGTNFTAWVCRIAKNCALARGRKRRPDLGLETHAVPDAKPWHNDSVGPDPRDHVGNLEVLGLGDALMQSLLQLDETPRACLLMRVVLEAPYEEIADALDVPASTAMSHVHRSRQRLAQRLGSPAAILEHDRTPRKGPTA